MEELFAKFAQRIDTVNTVFKRFLYYKINWNHHLIGIKGARGTGKTTLLLQYIKENFKLSAELLYISLDKIYFSNNSLTELVDEFVKSGGKYLFLDEVHKYPTWAIEIKNSYDDYPNLKIVFTGSSILDIVKAEADLSRRAIMYTLPELSLREYLELMYKYEFPVLKLEDILENHPEISRKVLQTLRPIPMYKEYNKSGAYPFVKETGEFFINQLETIINQVIETDLPMHTNIAYSTVNKLKKLLFIISESVPFKPNISKLSLKLDTSRDNLLKYLDLLEQAKLVKLLRPNTQGVSYLTKPEKIYLNNNSLMYAISKSNVNEGTIRETFFLNQLSVNYNVTYSKTGDFRVDNKYIFEIGGQNKTLKQIAGEKNAFIAADNIEFGLNQKIPLWLFGFLY